MPKSSPSRGTRVPQVMILRGPNGNIHLGNPLGKKRMGKNTRGTDFFKMNKQRTHTSPVVRTRENSGVTAPPRVRAANTKIYHATK